MSGPLVPTKLGPMAHLTNVRAIGATSDVGANGPPMAHLANVRAIGTPSDVGVNGSPDKYQGHWQGFKSLGPNP